MADNGMHPFDPTRYDIHPFDAAQALYWYCADHHEGQGSDLYRILSTLGIKPGMLERGPGEDGEPARMLYNALALTGD